MPHRFRTAFRHTGDALCLADAEGAIVEADPAAPTRFGVGADARGHLRDRAAFLTRLTRAPQSPAHRGRRSP